MSLLLDALKRAEEAKRQSAQDSALPAAESSPPPELTLAPQERSDSPLPDLRLHLDEVEKDLRAEANANDTRAAAATAARAPAAGGVAQAAARNVFAAKTTAPEPSRPRTLLIGGIAGGIGALAIAGYFGYQYMQLSGMLAPPHPVAMPAPRAEPLALIGEERAQATTPMAPALAPAAPIPRAGPAGEDVPDAAEWPRPIAEAVRSARADVPAAAPGPARPRTPRALAPGAPVQAAAPAPAPTPIRVTPTPPTVDPQLAAGYQALQAGQLGQAEAAYGAVLQSQPGNVDARLGMALIAARSGHPEVAEAEYLRVLEAEPRNTIAQAGLLSLGGSIPAAQRESRLKQLLAGPQPNPALTGLLQFALGNVYGEQRRWSEAQQAYFAATVADSGNPDYLYNLAVSLEHLQKPALAARHYEAALRAAQDRPFAFDRQQASARIEALPR